MSALSQAVPAIFSFDSHAIRTLTDERGNPLFCAKDVCQVLGYTNDSKAIKDHCATPGVTKRYLGVVTGKRTDGSNVTQQVETTFITEGNLYRLIVRSHKQEAVRFEKWLMDEVLPTIRQTGSYHMAAPDIQTAPAAIHHPSNVLMFNGVPVFTNAQLSEFFGVDRSTVRGNPVQYPDFFKVGVHYFKLSGHQLRNFLLANLHTGEVSRRSTRQLIIWNQDGAEAHAKLFPPNIAQRGRQAIGQHLAGKYIPVIDDTPAPPPPPGNTLPATTSHTPARIMLTFANAAALGTALPELLALTGRHAASLSMEGGAA